MRGGILFHQCAQPSENAPMQEKDRRSESVVLFPALPTARVSSVYSVTANDSPVQVECFETVHIARFAFTGTCNVAVAIRPSIGGEENRNVIYRHSLKPESCGIVPAVDGGTMKFTLLQPARLVLQANEYERLFILADPGNLAELKAGDARVQNVMDFATDNKGQVLQTDKIQRAVEATLKHGVLYFPPGVYLTGGFDLKNHMTLHLAGGAVLRGSSNPADYPKEKIPGRGPASRFIGIVGLQDVTVTGCGTIAGNGSVVRAAKASPNLLLVRNSKDVTIENVNLCDSAASTAHICNSDRVKLQNVKIVNNCYVDDAGGIDIETSRSVLVEDCFCFGDDAAVVRTPDNAQAGDITFRRNVLLARKAAFKVGPETQGAISRIVFADNDVIECDCGMCLYCQGSAVISNVTFERNRFHGCRPAARQRLIDFHTQDCKDEGRIEDVYIRNCEAASRWPRPSTMFGQSRNHCIKGIRFENFVVDGRTCRNMKDADLLLEVPPGCDLRLAGVYDITFVPPDVRAWGATPEIQ
jgi:hypothetical protein